MNRRRTMLLALTAAGFIPAGVLHAKPRDAADAMAAIIRQRTVSNDRVYVELAPLVENGNSVTVRFAVQSPMTASDYVKALHVISEGNPLPNVVSCYFTALSGKAEVTTRVRLAESQRLWVVAEMSDGSVYRAHADTVVTLSACTEAI